MKNQKILSGKLIRKLVLSFLLINTGAGFFYILVTLFHTRKFYSETSQKLNSNIVTHLIESKFKDMALFLENGEVNILLMDNLLCDIKSINKTIEVYLLDNKGEVLYSNALGLANPAAHKRKVDLKPVKKFMQDRSTYILGDDPVDPDHKKVFSATYFEKNGNKGYIYTIFNGKPYEEIHPPYLLALGLSTSLITIIFAALFVLLSVYFLVASLRKIICQINRFTDGDLNSRIENVEKLSLGTLAASYNKMADAISKNIEEIKSTDKFRRELIASVAHDLRSPLTTIQGYIETLQMKQKKIRSADQLRYLKIVEKSNNQLIRLVAQLYEYSKLETKHVKLCKEEFHMTHLIQDIKNRYSLCATRKNIKLVVSEEENVPAVYADINLIERAIQNILDNALKYTPINGKVELSIRYFRQKVIISIKDSGIGIKKEHQKYIFNRYYQSESYCQTQEVGLGLAIVKRIIDLHESKITLKSTLNKGSCFEFYLPDYKSATKLSSTSHY